MRVLRYPAAHAGHIIEVNDRYVLHNDRWKIAHRITNELLTPVAA